jgi:hypothetical protein
MAITQAQVQGKSKIKPLAVKPPIVSYEIPDSFNPFATGERLICLEFELKNQRELMSYYTIFNFLLGIVPHPISRGGLISHGGQSPL